ncbi:MAG: ankyrin repeat domain-containing protein [Rickettsiales bacterium]|nr:ankyrin repeat domain-containing protein [Rickettsiales bacterium]
MKNFSEDNKQANHSDDEDYEEIIVVRRFVARTPELGDLYRTLLYATAWGGLDVVNRLIESISVAERQEFIRAESYAAFRNAAQNGYINIVNRLIELTPVEERQEMIHSRGYSAFRSAAERGHLDIVNHLIELTPEAERQKMIRISLRSDDNARNFFAIISDNPQEHQDHPDLNMPRVEKLRSLRRILIEKFPDNVDRKSMANAVIATLLSSRLSSRDSSTVLTSFSEDLNNIRLVSSLGLSGRRARAAGSGDRPSQIPEDVVDVIAPFLSGELEFSNHVTPECQRIARAEINKLFSPLKSSEFRKPQALASGGHAAPPTPPTTEEQGGGKMTPEELEKHEAEQKRMKRADAAEERREGRSGLSSATPPAPPTNEEKGAPPSTVKNSAASSAVARGSDFSKGK